MRFNWLEVIGIGLIIASGVIAIQIYYNESFNECTSDPLVYAAKMYEEKAGYPFVGSGSFVGHNINSPIVTFNSEEVDISNPSSIGDADLFLLNISA